MAASRTDADTVVSHKTALRVRWGEVDPAGIVYYPRFFAWFDEASDELFRALGLPWERFFPEQGITGLPIVEVHCRFTAPLRYGDHLTIISTVAEVRDKTLRIEHVVKHGETTCAVGYEVRAWAAPAEDGALRARSIPEAVAARLRGDVDPSAEKTPPPRPLPGAERGYSPSPRRGGVGEGLVGKEPQPWAS